MIVSSRTVIVGFVMLAVLSPLQADFPEDNLSIKGLTRHSGDLPNCAELGEGRKICTWRASDDEYYTCFVGAGSRNINKSDCVYETVKARGRFPIVRDLSQYAKKRWEESYALAWKGVNTGSVLEVSRTVGHGPVVCMLADVLFCKWVTDNHSPGHHDSLRYLAVEDWTDKSNPHLRLICEFDLETLERTDTPCLVSSL